MISGGITLSFVVVATIMIMKSVIKEELVVRKHKKKRAELNK